MEVDADWRPVRQEPETGVPGEQKSHKNMQQPLRKPLEPLKIWGKTECLVFSQKHTNTWAQPP